MLYQSSKKLLFLAALFLFSSGLITFIWWGRLDLNLLLDNQVEWGILLLGLFIGLIILIRARRRGRLDIFEFPSWFSVNIYVQGVISVWLFYDDIDQYFPSLRSTFNENLLSSLILIGFSIGCLWIGNYLSISYFRRLPTKPTQNRRILNLPVVMVIWVLLWVYITFAVFSNLLGWGGVLIGVWSNYLAFIQLLYLASSAALLIYHFRNPTLLGWIWLVVALILTGINGVAVGTRGVVYYFIYIFILSYYATKRYRWSWLVLGVITLLILVPSATLFRQQLPQYQAVSIQQRLYSTFSSFGESINEPVTDLVSEVMDLFAARQGSIFLITASVMQQHDNANSYVGREMLEEFFIGVIPRIFWRSKPAGLTNLYNISTRYTDAPTEAVFSEIGIIADTYRAGGWWLVLIIFSLLGAVMGWVYWQGPLKGNDDWIVFYFLLLIMVSYSRPLLEISLIFFQRSILIWLFIYYVLFKRLPASN